MERAQKRAQGWIAQSVEGRSSHPPPTDDAAIAEDPQLLTDGWLVEVQQKAKVEDAQFVSARESVEHPQARGIGEKGERRGEHVGPAEFQPASSY